MQSSARTPLVPHQKPKLADVEVIIVEKLCKGCDYCIKLCPRKVLDHSPSLNVRGINPPYVKDKEACVGCGICEEICPDLAIYLNHRGETP